MSEARPFARVRSMLKDAGLRTTRQRLALARLLFEGGNRHVTAEQLHDEVQRLAVHVSLATVYNALHQFTAAGLLREVVVDRGRSYFDTNTAEHHHFYYEDSGRLRDIPAESVALAALPPPPDGAEVSRVDIVVRLTSSRR